MKYSRIEVDVTCVRCKHKEVLNTILGEFDQGTQMDWTCPMCGAYRVVYITKGTPGAGGQRNINPVSVTNWRVQDGHKIKVDGDGNPLDSGAHFIRPASKKSSSASLSDDVVVMDDED